MCRRMRDRCMHRSPGCACTRTLDCRSWTSVSATSRRIRAFRRARSRAWSRSAGRSRCSSPSTPTSPRAARVPYPGGGELPSKYWHCYDLFVALTAAAAATTRLRVGSGICLVIERDPITTAKEVASVDHLSGGRLEFGVGAGWNREEMRNHGTDPRTRMELMRERIEAMKAIWTQDEASYAGRFVSFERIWSDPKPAQRPHPPILVGGAGPGVLDRVLAFGDAWLPILRTAACSSASRSCTRAPSGRSRSIAFMPPDARELERALDAGVAPRDLLAPVRRAAPSSSRRSSAGRRRSPSWSACDGGEARARFAAAPLAHLASADADGRPHLVPITFALVGDTIYSAVDAPSRKRTPALRRLANIAANPRVAVLVDHYEDDWDRLWWVRADGRARTLDAGAPRRARRSPRSPSAIAVYRRSPPPGPVLAIDVERWVGWSAAGE